MQFRLTYEGPLRTTQRDPENGQRDPRAGHKHDIRQAFHVQLKRLWAVNRNLNGSPTEGAILLESSPDPPPRDVAELAKHFDMFGWNFVPLVTESLCLICGLDILLLRPGEPGGVVNAGDIDNRLKTLFDALAIPNAHDRYIDRTASEDEKPFYCLLENDKLITSVAVETDTMLQPIGQKLDAGDVRLVINVKLRPYFVGIGNSHFG
jgi:hypothetical protein